MNRRSVEFAELVLSGRLIPLATLPLQLYQPPYPPTIAEGN